MTTKVYRVISHIPYDEHFAMLHTRDFDSAYRYAKKVVRDRNKEWGNGRGNKSYLQGMFYFDHNYYGETGNICWISGWCHQVIIDCIEVH